MTLRFTCWLALLASSTASLPAQSNLFGNKVPQANAAPVEQPATIAPGAPAAGVAAEAADTGVIITPFRQLAPPEAKSTRTFQISKLNRLGATETTKDLQRLYSAFAMQRIVDGSPEGSSKALGYLTAVNYSLIQDLGENRFLAKAAWPPAGAADGLPAGVDAMAILLLEKPAKVGDTGKIVGMHVGTVSLRFTAEYAPLTGRRLTLRREAFLECTTLEDTPAGFRRFGEAILAGTPFTVLTQEQSPCKPCSGMGFTRKPQKGELLDKRVGCTECAGLGKISQTVETKFVP
jgi:hypothetical protein